MHIKSTPFIHTWAIYVPRIPCLEVMEDVLLSETTYYQEYDSQEDNTRADRYQPFHSCPLQVEGMFKG